MMAYVSPLMTTVGLLCLWSAAMYAALNCGAQLAWRLPRRARPGQDLPPVTVLKPLCGAEPGLYEDLRSFCRQDYPDYQIVFGVRDEDDPACAVVRRLAAEFPALPITIVVNSKLHGSNLKISNLINMLECARHELLVMADSDAYVESHYLRAIAPPMHDPRVGLVTCIYRGMPTPGVWSRMGAMYINEWFVPCILLAWLFGHQGYVSGQTVCVRQATLRALGGLAALANHLADDNRLGTLVRGLGLRIHLSRYVVTGEHHEPSLDCVIRHEVRWMSTLRVLRPRSFRWLFLTFSLPLAVTGMIFVLAAGPTAAQLGIARPLFAVTLILRVIVHVAHRLMGRQQVLADLWLLPARDILLCWVWLRCFFTSKVTWRGLDFNVDSDGVMHRVS